jgi:DNA (cytosine-5)-methyltransferase 1
MSYTVGSLFAGIGGICYGFKQAGCEVLWANEIDKAASETYNHNFPEHNLISDDIHNLKKPKDNGKVDIITSGFPCQAFSNAGYKKGFDDPRGNLFFETARFIKDIKPKAFLLENVNNLKSHDNGNTFEVIKDVISQELGYSFRYFVINSKDYGNIPQTRSRIYIVGFRSKECANNFRELEKIPLTLKIKDILINDEQDSNHYFQKDHQYYPILKEKMTSDKTVYQWRRVYLREIQNGLCPTLTANMGTGGHNVPLIKDRFGFRRLTPEECLRFQGFPDEFSFPQDISNTQRYKQVGNSVVVPVIKRIADEMLRVLDLKYNT